MDIDLRRVSLQQTEQHLSQEQLSALTQKVFVLSDAYVM